MKYLSQRTCCVGLLACLLVWFVPTTTSAETAIQAWVQSYNGPGNNTDYGRAVAADRSNNIFVGGTSLGASSGWDYAIIKYSSSGVPLWTNRYNGLSNSHDGLNAMTVDGSDNVIATGYSTVGTNKDYATIKYSGGGVPLWTNFYNGPGDLDDQAKGVVVDSNDNVIVTGRSGTDYLTRAYSSAGALLWTARYNSPANGWDEPAALALDGDNNVIVTGRSPVSGTSEDYLTIKYSSAGVPLWTNRFDAAGNSIDYATALAVDSSNNVIVTGVTSGPRGYYDFGTVKYSSAGVPLWTNYYHAPSATSCYASAVAVDGNGNVFVTGDCYVPGEDFALVKYSSAGALLWAKSFNGPANGDDIPRALTVDANENVIVTGYTAGSCATIKYSNGGVPIWTNNYSGPTGGGYNPSAITMDRNGDAIIAGQSNGGPGGFDCTVVKFVSAPVIAGAQMTNGQFQVSLHPPNTVVIEGSTNLASQSAWTPIFTNRTSTNLLFYVDPGTNGHRWRFYRATRLQ